MPNSAPRRATRAVVASMVALLLAASASLEATAAKAPSGGSWASAATVSPVLQPDPTRGSQHGDVAVNAAGVAVAAWDQFSYANGGASSIGAAVETAGRWGTPFTISGTSSFAMSPRVAAGADGTLAVSWTSADPVAEPGAQQRVEVAVRRPGASGWTTSTLASGASGGVSIARFAPLAIDAAGTVTATWSLWNGTRDVVGVARLVGDGSWDVVPDVAPGLDGLFPAVAVDARGDAAIAFVVTPYPGTLMTSYAAFVSRSAGASGWTVPAVVSEVIPSSVGYVSNPSVALDAAGTATVAYLGYGLEVVRGTAIAGWSSPRTVVAAPNSVSSWQGYELAVDDNGGALVAASLFDATINVDRASIWVARTVGGSWTPAVRVTDPAVPVDAYAPCAALAPDGSVALVGWIDHYHGSVHVARLTGSAWARTTIGRGTAFSSFQEVLGLDLASAVSGRAIWKSAKSGTRWLVADFRG